MNDKEAIEALQELKKYCQSHDCYMGECPLRNFCNDMWTDAYSLEDAVTDAFQTTSGRN